MTENFIPNIDRVILPFQTALYIPDIKDKIIRRDGVLLEVCHSYNPEDCIRCINTKCKFAGENGRKFIKFWDRFENVNYEK